MTTRNITAGVARNRRWGILSGIDIGADGDPYLDRLRLIETPRFSVYLHHIHRPDTDPDPHDHPWFFASLVLCGGYTELIWPDKHDSDRSYWRIRNRGSLRCLRRKAAHKITQADGPLWTLVITGRGYGTESWGFWVKDGPRHARGVQWRVYVEQAALAALAAEAAAREAAGRSRPGQPVIRDLRRPPAPGDPAASFAREPRDRYGTGEHWLADDAARS